MGEETQPPPLRWSRALVTGASSGIGECIARKLAAEGVSLILVARRRQLLEALAGELRRKSESQIEVLCGDLTDRHDLVRIEERLSSTKQPIDLLVNNAGSMRLTVFPGGDEEKLVYLNIVAVVRLTAAVVPSMRARRRGTILNISSGAAFHPHPYAAAYGASKAFLNSFSLAVREENRKRGVSVTVVCPGFTETDLAERAGFDVSRLPRIFWMTPDQVAECAIGAARRRKALCVPGLINKVDAAFGRYGPVKLVARLVATSTRRLNLDLRE